jgi:hypothetical protein
VETVFAALFVLTLVLPPAAIVASVVALALGSHRDLAQITIPTDHVDRSYHQPASALGHASDS